MSEITPNINIKFDDDFDIDINEQELIKNIDFSQLNNSQKNISYPNNIIPASEFLKNNNIPLNPFKDNPSKENQKTNNIPEPTNNHENPSKMTNMNMPCEYSQLK